MNHVFLHFFSRIRWCVKHVFFGLTLMAWTNYAFADKPVLTFGYIEFAPFYSTYPDGQGRGPFIDMARELGAAIGHDIKPVSLPPKRAVKLVGSGEVDFWFGLATNALYNDNVYISKEPIDRLELRAYSIKPMGSFNGRDDLVGKSIVIVRGYTYGGLRDFINDEKNEIYAVQVSNIVQALKVLDIRELDYVLGYTRPMSKALQEYPLPEINSRILSSLDIHMTLHKNINNSKKLMEGLEKFQLNHFPSVERSVQSPH